MEKETKDGALHKEAQGDAADLQSEPTHDAPLAAQRAEHTNGLSQKRGRIMAAGGLSAVLLAVVAVIVAGIFGFTSAWLKLCPAELPVNDPARQLSQQLTSDKGQPQPLGVSERIAEQVRLKGIGSAQ